MARPFHSFPLSVQEILLFVETVNQPLQLLFPLLNHSLPLLRISYAMISTPETQFAGNKRFRKGIANLLSAISHLHIRVRTKAHLTSLQILVYNLLSNLEPFRLKAGGVDEIDLLKYLHAFNRK